MLVDITGLQYLISVGGQFFITDNDLLTDLSPLENIDPNSITDLSIYNNPQLSDCDIQSICGYLVSPAGSVDIHDNAPGCNSQGEVEDDCENNCLPEGIEFETQASIDNFQSNYPGCTEIEGDVTIGKFMNSSNITNVDGLSVMTAIGGFLDFRLNNYLTSIVGLSNLNSVGGLLSVYNNDALTDLSGLNQVSSIDGQLYITYNDALIDITALESLTFVGGDLVIAENSVLPELTGLNNLTTIGGGLEIRLDNVLTSISSLSSLNSIGDHVWIAGNDILESLAGLEGLTTIPGYLEIRYDAELQDLSGLDNITSIGGYLEIRENQNLVNLAGLHNLTSIGGSMEFRNNQALQDFQALVNLTSIGAEFRVSQNDLLTSLSGLDNIEAASISDLYIHNNALLSTCDIESVCNYLAAPNGAIYILENADGCTDQEEVEEACFTSVTEIAHGDIFTISPNPTSGSTFCRLATDNLRQATIDIIDFTGRKINRLVIEEKASGTYAMEIDLSDIPAGIYFCTLKTNPAHAGLTKKIIKL